MFYEYCFTISLQENPNAEATTSAFEAKRRSEEFKHRVEEKKDDWTDSLSSEELEIVIYMTFFREKKWNAFDDVIEKMPAKMSLSESKSKVQPKEKWFSFQLYFEYVYSDHRNHNGARTLTSRNLRSQKYRG